MISIFFIILFASVNVCRCDETEDPHVKTPLGEIRGRHKKSHEGKVFSSFEGIPYAKPPTGNLRFQPPEPATPWDGIWYAKDTYQCLQTSLMRFEVVSGQEDCLYLNVYVPRKQPDPREKLEVVVHIHGGGFMYGSGDGYASPDFLMDRDLILVTFNYRLGIFGFLSTGDQALPGNYGLKDQVEALKWIQRNIAGFGGNPESVTLTGLSAGASAVHLHYLSPLSKGLFHRGISTSGVAINPWSLQEEPLRRARILAASVGCPEKNTGDLANCLRNRPAQQIIAKMNRFFGYRFLPQSPFSPVVEEGKNGFLTKNPYFLLLKGEVHDLPWITSNTAHEGLFPAGIFVKELEEINKNWTDIAPFFLDYNDTLAKVLHKETAKQIKSHYLGERDIDKDSLLDFVKIVTDRLYTVDSEAAVRLQSKANKSPVYYYHFSYAADDSQFKTVAHGEDARFFFNKMFARNPTPEEADLKDLFLDMLVAFTKTNKPSIAGVDWEPATFEELKFLNISSYDPQEMTLKTSVEYLTPRQFWSDLGFLENQNIMLIKDEL